MAASLCAARDPEHDDPAPPHHPVWAAHQVRRGERLGRRELLNSW